MAGQPTAPPNVTPTRNESFLRAYINHWFPLIRPALKPLFRGGDTFKEGVGRLTNAMRIGSKVQSFSNFRNYCWWQPEIRESLTSWGWQFILWFTRVLDIKMVVGHLGFLEPSTVWWWTGRVFAMRGMYFLTHDFTRPDVASSVSMMGWYEENFRSMAVVSWKISILNPKIGGLEGRWFFFKKEGSSR